MSFFGSLCPRFPPLKRDFNLCFVTLTGRFPGLTRGGSLRKKPNSPFDKARLSLHDARPPNAGGVRTNRP